MRFYRNPKIQALKIFAVEKTEPPENEFIRRLEELRKQQLPGKNKVIIIGAGIAGLSAAYELKQLGVEVVILEAQADHIGGRVRTYRTDDLYAEFGAMRIPAAHTLTHKYIQDLGLTLRDFVQDNPNTFCQVRNHVFRRSNEGIEESKSLFNLPEHEKPIKFDGFWQIAVLSILEKLTTHEIKDLFANDPREASIKTLDRSSLHEAFVKAGISAEATEFVLTHFGLETYLQTSLAEHLREEQQAVWTSGFSEIEGGTDLLAKKFYEQLTNEVVRPAEVFKISQDADKAVVFFRNDAGVHQVSGDWVICTAPLGVVSKMEMEDISNAKRRAIRRVNYDSSTKVIAHTTRRFWEQDDGIFGGGSIYDGPLGHTWYPSDNAEKKDPAVSARPSLLLASYTWGQAARRIDAIPESSLQSFIISELQKIHKKLQPADIEKVNRWSWTEHPWSMGAFAFFNPGEHQFLYRFLKQPENRIILAGEHCSLTHSWIQGALESAIDACSYIIEQIQSKNTDDTRNLSHRKAEELRM